jgi:alpha-galactosidase
MTAPIPPYVRLDGDAVTLVVATAGGIAAVVYWGPRLSDATDSASLALLAARAEAPASPFPQAPLGLTPQMGQGWSGRPGLAAHRDGLGWASLATLTGVSYDGQRAQFEAVDALNGIKLSHDLAIEGDVLVARTTLTNLGDSTLTVESLAAPVLPLPGFATDIIGFEGRWAGEFQATRQPRQMGSWVRENRRGRTSHDAFPGLIIAEAATTEHHGLAFGFHSLGTPMTLREFRDVFHGPLVAACGYTLEAAEAAIDSGAADLVAFGRPYLANPDLVERFRHGWPLADLPDMAYWWTPQGARGYTDFPSHGAEAG